MKLNSTAISLVRLSTVGLMALTSGCIHKPIDGGSLSLAEKAMRVACVPFIIVDVDYAQVGQALGGGWTQSFPDPFTPAAGPIYRNRGVTVQVVDGRQQRSPDGTLTSQPLRTCNVWMGPEDEVALTLMVRRVATSNTSAKMVPIVGTVQTLRIVACIPIPNGAAVLRSSIYGNRTTGAGIYQTVTERLPAACKV